MPLYAETYKQVADRFKEWMTDRDQTGDFVSNVVLDYINRANQVLWGKDFWDDLMAHQALTVSSRAATLPSDYGRTYCVYHDTDGDGKPDWYYSKDGKYGHGYKLTRTYAKATGSTFTMTFFKDPDHTPVLLYVKVLADFAASEAAEYLFWPAELLLKQAQLLYKQDADDMGGDYDRLKIEHRELLTDFRKGHQFTNPDFCMEQNDAAGNVVENESFDLLLGGDGGNHNHYDNTTDLG